MSLIKCRECGNRISKIAKICPQCGAKNKKTRMGLIAIACFILLGMIGFVSIPHNSSSIVQNQTGTSEIKFNKNSDCFNQQAKVLSFHSIFSQSDIEKVQLYLRSNMAGGKGKNEITDSMIFVSIPVILNLAAKVSIDNPEDSHLHDLMSAARMFKNGVFNEE